MTSAPYCPGNHLYADQERVPQPKRPRRTKPKNRSSWRPHSRLASRSSAAGIAPLTVLGTLPRLFPAPVRYGWRSQSPLTPPTFHPTLRRTSPDEDSISLLAARHSCGGRDVPFGADVSSLISTGGTSRCVRHTKRPMGSDLRRVGCRSGLLDECVHGHAAVRRRACVNATDCEDGVMHHVAALVSQT